MVKTINKYTVDELNNMQLEHLELLEKEVWQYYKRIDAVIKLQKALENEDDE